MKTSKRSPLRAQAGLLALFLAAWLPPPTRAETVPHREIVIDLAAIGADTVFSRPGRAGTEYSFRLVNRLPDSGVSYEVSIEISQTPIRELTLFGAVPPQGGGSDKIWAMGAGGIRTPDPCDGELEEARKLLAKASAEYQVPEKLAASVKLLSQSCSNRAEELRLATEQSIDSNEATLLGSGEELEVLVKRKKSDGTSTSWTYRLTTASGEWRAAYGFTFVPNEDERFFTEAQPSGAFKIMAQADRERLDYVPSVLFTWSVPQDAQRSWQNGFTAGLGYDLEQPVVFAGWAWTVHQNVIVTAGVAVHRQSRLLGRYREGQEVAENLEPAQLTEHTYGPNAFAGVAFRFGQDPHARTAQLQAARASREATEVAKAAAATEAKAQKEKRIAACEEAARAQRAAETQACLKDNPVAADGTDPKKQDREACETTAEAKMNAAIAECPVADQVLADKEQAAAAKRKEDDRTKAEAAAVEKAKEERKKKLEEAALELRGRCDALASAAADKAKSQCASELEGPEKAACETAANEVLAKAKLDCHEAYMKAVAPQEGG